MKNKTITFFLSLAVLAVAILALTSSTATAQTGSLPILPTPPSPGVSNDTCLTCHGVPDQQITLPSGEILYLTVDADTFNHSVHGKDGYACVQCHTNITKFPHPQLTAQTRREVTLSMYPACARCHEQMYSMTLDSVHEQALSKGNENAAVCTDCHGAHNVTPPDQPRSRIPQTCERCHSEIYKLYAESVHGSALIGDGNPDVPSCIDCHGVHNVEGPNNSPFLLKSPEICARCHTDKKLMDKYGISTNVLNTYLADFHGTTVIFESSVPGQETNKPVCVDCHSVHDIRKPDDPQSTVMKENLLATCNRCHEDASTNFSSAWLSHYEPSPQHYPVVYYVNEFYKFFIPTLLGGMALLVVADGSRRIYDRRKNRSQAHTEGESQKNAEDQAHE